MLKFGKKKIEFFPVSCDFVLSKNKHKAMIKLDSKPHLIIFATTLYIMFCIDLCYK